MQVPNNCQRREVQYTLFYISKLDYLSRLLFCLSLNPWFYSSSCLRCSFYFIRVFHSILVISAVISVWQMKIGLGKIMTWSIHSNKQGQDQEASLEVSGTHSGCKLLNPTQLSFTSSYFLFHLHSFRIFLLCGPNGLWLF